MQPLCSSEKYAIITEFCGNQKRLRVLSKQETQKQYSDFSSTAMKIAITIENRCTFPILAGNIQILAEGMPGVDYAKSVGFRRGLGFCYLYQNQECLGVGQKILVEVETFRVNNILTVGKQHDYIVRGGEAVVLK